MHKLDGREFNSLKEVAIFYKIPYTTFLHRIEAGLPLSDAIQPIDRCSRQLTVQGKIYDSIASAARFYGVANTTVINRLARGWSPGQALGLEPKPKQKRKATSSVRSIEVIVNGRRYSTVTEAANAFNFPRQKFYNRLKKGLSPEQALELEPFPDWFTPGTGKHATKTKNKKIQQESNSNQRRCSCCAAVKPLDQFHNSSSGKRYTRCATCTAKYFIRYRYGITFEEFERKLKLQNKNCAICGNDLKIKADNISRNKNVHVDHCHKTGKVRGILCKNCNLGLGFFFDSTSNLLHAVEYLRSYA